MRHDDPASLLDHTAAWSDADVCRFYGVSPRSITSLMELRGFPKPIPLPFRGRRWDPQHHIDFRRRLVEAEAKESEANEVPTLSRQDARRALGLAA